MDEDHRGAMWFKNLLEQETRTGTDLDPKNRKAVYEAYLREAQRCANDLRSRAVQCAAFTSTQASLRQVDMDIPRTQGTFSSSTTPEAHPSGESFRMTSMQNLVLRFDPVEFQSKLRNVLYAYTIRYSKMGYTQGVNEAHHRPNM